MADTRTGIIYADAGTYYHVDRDGQVASGTDAATVINNAISTWNSRGGGTLHLLGTFDLSSPITPLSNVHLLGAGWNNTLLTSSLASGEALIDNTSGGFQNIRIANMEIDGSGTASGTYDPLSKCIGLSAEFGSTAPQDVVIENCYCHDSVATAIGIDAIPGLHVRNCLVENAGTDGESQGSNGIGIGTGRVSGQCPNFIRGNEVYNTSQFAVIMEQTGDTLVGEQVTISDNLIRDAKYGIGVELLKGYDVMGNQIRNIGDTGIHIGQLDHTVSPTYGTVVSNTVLGSVTNYSIRADAGCDYTVIESNTIDSGGTISAVPGSAIIVNGYGEEAAGSGNSPTNADWGGWASGYMIHNTDDDTFWIIDRSGTWFQVS